jgi:hypothetical protein
MKRWITFVALAAGIIKAGMAAELWVGAAEADITPDQPVALTGGRTGPISRGVNSRISANVLAIEAREGDRAIDAAILVACDVCSIRTGIQARFRELVAPRLKGFDINKLILTATHTHKGPALDQANYDSYEGAMQPDEYVPFMFERMADAVVRAWESRQRGSLAWGLGYAMVAQNRRAVYANGSAEMYGRTDRAECRGLEGYSDHAVDSLFFLDEAGAMKAIAVTVPCPAQTDERGPCGQRISADFWHDVRQGLKAKHGEKVVVLGFVAPSGDQSPHLMVRHAAETRMDKLRKLSRTQEMGRRIVAAVEDTWETVKVDIRTDVPFAHRVERFDLPELKLPEAEYLKAKREYDALNAKKELKGPDYWNKRWNERVVKRFEAQRNGPTFYPVEMHVLRLGDVAFATNPFELFTDYGIQIQGRSPAQQTVLVQLARSIARSSYLATPRALAGGGYSAVPQSCEVGPEGGQMLVERTVDVIRQLFSK